MSRDWIAAYLSVLGKSKYRRMSIEGRAALFHVWLLAGGQTPEATWPTADELGDVLELDGFPTGVLGELIERRWLDVDEAGRILVHEWDEHQLAASNAARKAYERDRKAEWRRQPEKKAGPPLPAPSSPIQDSTTSTEHNTTQVSRDVPKRPGPVRDLSGTRAENLVRKEPVPTSGQCRDCGAFVRDHDEGVRVGPGFIEHAEHPAA